MVTFFTLFNQPVEIENSDCDMLQSTLQHSDLSNGLALMINSPGGDGLAAERIVSTCRAYSGTGDYWAIVPGRAKSAATIVCMGASKILMAASSELGPVDPQIIRIEAGGYKVFSAHSLITSYRKLFESAVRTKGNLEPFVQQLNRYDAREVQKYIDSMDLAEDIAIKVLKSGIMRRKSKATIKKNIRIFLDPAAGTIAHGRSISREEASACGLEIENLDVRSAQWRAIYELYTRTDLFVSTGRAAKVAESREEAFFVSAAGCNGNLGGSAMTPRSKRDFASAQEELRRINRLIGPLGDDSGGHEPPRSEWMPADQLAFHDGDDSHASEAD